MENVSTELAVSYFNNPDSAFDAQIEAVAEKHGFKRNGSGAGFGSRDITFEIQGTLTQQQKIALASDLIDLGDDLEARCTVWPDDEDADPVDNYDLVSDDVDLGDI